MSVAQFHFSLDIFINSIILFYHFSGSADVKVTDTCDISGRSCVISLYDISGNPEVSTAGCRVIQKDR